MARIDINKTYENYLQSQVKNGLYRSITAAAEGAIKKEMDEYENRRIASVMVEVQKGIDDVRAGRTHKFSKELFDDIFERGKQKAALKLNKNV